MNYFRKKSTYNKTFNSKLCFIIYSKQNNAKMQ